MSQEWKYDFYQATTPVDFHYYVVIPILGHGNDGDRYAFVGEVDKYITASRQRIAQIAVDNSSLRVSVNGVLGEGKR
jgi:hypothetical protein